MGATISGLIMSKTTLVLPATAPSLLASMSNTTNVFSVAVMGRGFGSVIDRTLSLGVNVKCSE